jgi:hypothetical protein
MFSTRAKAQEAADRLNAKGLDAIVTEATEVTA